MIDALVDLEEASRLAHVAPSEKTDEREEFEAETKDEVGKFVNARKRI